MIAMRRIACFVVLMVGVMASALGQLPIDIVVHRGANALAPENTWPSAEAALQYGATWIEVDVRKSKDGVLFNLHDETLDRTTNGKGLLSEMMSDDVRRLDAGSWFGPQYAGLRVPTIAEMLDSLQGRAFVFFDVKRGTPVPALVSLVREKGFADKSFFWFGDEGMLREFTTLAPEMKIKVNAGDIERLKYWQTICKPAYVEIAPEKITDKFRSYCRRHGIKVMAACQEDDTSQFQLVIDKKADLVNLDRPEEFLPLLRNAFPASFGARPFTLRTDQLQIPADGTTLCTRQLQEAIDAISQKGGGRLTLAAGRYLSGGLMLRTGVELHLEQGAVLLGSTNPYDYQPIAVGSTADRRNDNSAMALIMADGAAHVSITGSGTIDGQGLQLALNIDSLHHTGERPDPHYNQRRQRPGETARPKLLFLHGCSNVLVEGVRLTGSANWGLSFHSCQLVRLTGLDIVNRAYWNNDGIDLTDCRSVLVADCRINSADDGVCLKSYQPDGECCDIEVARCDIRSSASAVKFGTASWGGFRKVHVHDIRVSDTFRSAIAIESVDGGHIDGILVERIHAVNTGNPVFLRLGHRAGAQPGTLRGVTIRNLSCEVPFGRPDEAYDLRGPEVNFFHNPFPGSICGIPGHPVEQVLIENVTIRYPGRATRGMAYVPLWRAGDVPEQTDQYPEFSMFGELPAWGFYVRHADGVTFRNVSLTLAADDFRPAFVLDDAKGVTFERVTPADPDQYFFATK